METGTNPPEQEQFLGHDINGLELKAIEKRYFGASHEEISDYLEKEFGQKIAPSTLRKWFMRGGKLANTYEKYADEMNKFTFFEAQNFLRSLAFDAVKGVRRYINHHNPNIGLKASLEVIDRTIGKDTLRDPNRPKQDYRWEHMMNE